MSLIKGEEATEAADMSQAAGDPRADLIVQLILAALETQVAPNLAHVLLGFDVALEPDALQRSILTPRWVRVYLG